MSMAAIAIGVGAAATAGGAYMNSQATKSAAAATNAANAKNTADTNALNYQMWRESRDSILPTYAAGSEASIYNDLLDAYNASKSGSRVSSTYNAITDAMQGGNTAISNLMTGQTAEDRNALYNEIMQARNAGTSRVNSALLQGVGDVNAQRLAGVQSTNAANTAAINQGLRQSIGSLNAQRAASGLTGGSSYANNLAQGATIGARTQAGVSGARSLADAYLQNAQQQAAAQNSIAQLLAQTGETNATGKMNVYDQNTQQILGNLNAPYQVLQNAQTADNIRNYGSLNNLLNTLGFFKIGTTQAPTAQTAQYQTVPQSGQAVGSMLSSLGSTALNYGLNSSSKSGASGGTGYTPSSTGYYASDGTWVMPEMTINSGQ